MLNDPSSQFQREDPVSPDPKSHARLLSVQLDAGAASLPRLANLMAKLDIEPDTLLIEKSPCGERLDVSITLDGDGDAAEKLSLRLSGMVAVCSVSAA